MLICLHVSLLAEQHAKVRNKLKCANFRIISRCAKAVRSQRKNKQVAKLAVAAQTKAVTAVLENDTTAHSEHFPKQTHHETREGENKQSRAQKSVGENVVE